MCFNSPSILRSIWGFVIFGMNQLRKLAPVGGGGLLGLVGLGLLGYGVQQSLYTGTFDSALSASL